jgi:hypothetical protein
MRLPRTADYPSIRSEDSSSGQLSQSRENGKLDVESDVKAGPLKSMSFAFGCCTSILLEADFLSHFILEGIQEDRSNKLLAILSSLA